MAIQIKNGQLVTSTAAEVEVQLIDGSTPSVIYFLAPTGTVRVTVGPRGGSGIVGGEIRAFVLADGVQRMSVSPSPTGGTSLFIKEAGTIFFTW